ncbi:hypothetical protein BOTBODRAFT_37267 [Botryobasidium botryosum FD-172 SS1]|uniref:Protein kinase domain-containing protein n=1 Tax=Botryobasidium botryosum (strain FD-172 SS1) TaxID=930990 RepID=A0A067M0B9_BOTB1|nr:hypothetical protein BOTBODRAFT_37267 [Botryobasidium botryosum FD-172 SS1]
MARASSFFGIFFCFTTKPDSSHDHERGDAAQEKRIDVAPAAAAPPTLLPLLAVVSSTDNFRAAVEKVATDVAQNTAVSHGDHLLTPDGKFGARGRRTSMATAAPLDPLLCFAPASQSLQGILIISGTIQYNKEKCAVLCSHSRRVYDAITNTWNPDKEARYGAHVTYLTELFDDIHTSMSGWATLDFEKSAFSQSRIARDIEDQLRGLDKSLTVFNIFSQVKMRSWCEAFEAARIKDAAKLVVAKPPVPRITVEEPPVGSREIAIAEPETAPPPSDSESDGASSGDSIAIDSFPTTPAVAQSPRFSIPDSPKVEEALYEDEVEAVEEEESQIMESVTIEEEEPQMAEEPVAVEEEKPQVEEPVVVEEPQVEEPVVVEESNQGEEVEEGEEEEELVTEETVSIDEEELRADETMTAVEEDPLVEETPAADEETIQDEEPTLVESEDNFEEVILETIHESEAESAPQPIFTDPVETAPAPLTRTSSRRRSKVESPTEETGRQPLTVHRMLNINLSETTVIDEVQCQKAGEEPVAQLGAYELWKGSWVGDQNVALKVLSTPREDETNKHVERCDRQIKIWSTLSSQYILPLYGVCGDDEPFPYLISPWCKNGSARDYLKDKPVGVRMNVCLEVAYGLRYLHTLSPPVVLGSLKGSNVLISDEGAALLADFSVSNWFRSEYTDNDIPRTMFRWMAPEVPGAAFTKESDIWAWAMTTLELISGEDPFHMCVGPHSIGRKLSKGQPHYASLGFDANLWKLLESCWQSEPEKRPTIDRVVETMMTIRDAHV